MGDKRKIGLVLPSAIWIAPFVRIYTRILDTMDVDYSIISWTRDGEDKPEGFQYKVKAAHGHGSASLKEYLGYVRFVRKTIRREKFDKLIVFCPQTVCLLADFLLLHYRGRFMIDYRDLSIEQKKGFKQLYSFMLKRSSLNVISSPGFKKFLPKHDYVISHNFDEAVVRNILSSNSEETTYNISDGVDILTIGGIRDYSSNIQVIDGIANQSGFNLRFIGRGGAAARLEEYAKQKNAHNVSFKGYYEKIDEPGIIKTSTFLNIFYPRLNSHDSALSNRFYNSLLYRKPMIVTKNTTQGNYAEKYGVGIALDNCENLPNVLQEFLNNDYSTYANNCDELLFKFLTEQDIFVEKFKQFIKG